MAIRAARSVNDFHSYHPQTPDISICCNADQRPVCQPNNSLATVGALLHDLAADKDAKHVAAKCCRASRSVRGRDI